jgi:hypothetical protein
MLGGFVTKPFTNLKKSREIFKQHQNCSYHKHAVTIEENIRSIINNKTESVINQIKTQRKINVVENRKIVFP